MQAQASPIDSLERALGAATADTTRLRLLHDLAFLLQRTYPEKSIQRAEEALRLARSISHPTGEINALKNIGAGYIAQGNVLEGIEYVQQSIALARQHNDSARLANALQVLAGAYNTRSQYPQALAACLEALRIHEAQNDELAAAGALNNAGILYLRQEKYAEAQQYYLRALAIYEANGKQMGIASVCNNLGTIALNLHQYAAARAQFQRSLTIKQAAGELRGIANSLSNLGETLRLAGKTDSAMAYFRQALEIFVQTKDIAGEARSRFNQAQVFQQERQWEQAIAFATQATQLATLTGEHSLLADINEVLSEVYQATNRPAEALVAYKQFIRHRDSVQNEASALKFTELEFAYAIEKKEQTNQFLRERNGALESRSRLMLIIGILLIVGLLAAGFFSLQLNRRRKIIEAQRDDLTHLNAFKDRFIGIIAHDLRSPLASFESVAEGISYLLHQNQPERIAAMLDHLAETTGRFHRLLENLLRWALTQQKGQFPFAPGPVPVSEVIHETLAMLEGKQLAKGISLNTAVAPGLIWQADPDAFASVVRNLTDNAMKFAPIGSVIGIKASISADTLVLLVENEVAGTPPNPHDVFRPEKRSRKIGTSGEKGTGLGLILCRELVELHQGTLTMSVAGQRVSLRATFPQVLVQ